MDSNTQNNQLGGRDIISPLTSQNDNGNYFTINSGGHTNASGTGVGGGGGGISSTDKNNANSTSSSTNTSTTTSASENLYDEYKRRLELIKKINPIK